MKRNLHLRPLSRQHHNGLLAVLLLRKGIKKNAAGSVMNDFIESLFKEDLEEHFLMEEKYLLPPMLQHPVLKPFAEKILEDHRQLHMLSKKANQSGSPGDITVFADHLEQHIRFEERTAFPAAEKYLKEEELESIGNILKHHDDKNCISYPVKFWE
ncbi:MAG: hemerythrin domain-containing protein [Ferruginibacter sp.]